MHIVIFYRYKIPFVKLTMLNVDANVLANMCVWATSLLLVSTAASRTPVLTVGECFTFLNVL